MSSLEKRRAALSEPRDEDSLDREHDRHEDHLHWQSARLMAVIRGLGVGDDAGIALAERYLLCWMLAQCYARWPLSGTSTPWITWARMTKLADDYLPKPIILHPWPSDRFAVTHPR